MPMAASVLPPPLREGDQLTREEFLRRWEAMPDLKRAELIDGIVHMPSPVSRPLGTTQYRLSAWLGLYEAATPGCEGMSAGTWLMSNRDVPQPDLTLAILPDKGGQSRVEENYAAGAPELIVEVSHTTTARDKGIKLRLYERMGVREYLICEPAKRRITWLELEDGKFHALSSGPDCIWRSNVFPGLWLDPVALWNNDVAGLAKVIQQGTATPEHAEFVKRLS